MSTKITMYIHISIHHSDEIPPFPSPVPEESQDVPFSHQIRDITRKNFGIKLQKIFDISNCLMHWAI
jgi:hypothetical protein